MNKEELEKVNKLRKYLKDKYHLCVSTDFEKVEWALYKRYVDQNIYYSNDNKAIMTSETNTVEELEKYLKDHYENSFSDIVNIASFIITIVLWMLYIIELINFKKSTYFLGFLLGGLACNSVYVIISAILTQRHYEVTFLELKEESDKLEKSIKENLEVDINGNMD